MTSRSTGIGLDWVEDLTRDIFANLEDGHHVKSIDVWKPEPGPHVVRVLFDGIDLFAERATNVIGALRQRGFSLDESNPYHPELIRSDMLFGLNLEGGEDVDEEADDGLSIHIRSIFVAPAGYRATP